MTDCPVVETDAIKANAQQLKRLVEDRFSRKTAFVVMDPFNRAYNAAKVRDFSQGDGLNYL